MFILQLSRNRLVSTVFIQVSVVQAELHQGVRGGTEILRLKMYNMETV